MRIINPQWTNLAKGYKTALELEQQARLNWETKWAQSVEFARQQSIKRTTEFVQAQIQNEKRTLRIILALLAAIVLLMAVLSTLADLYPQLRWLLLPVGVINLLQGLVLFLPIINKLKTIATLNKTEAQPEEPETNLNITSQWWQTVTSTETLEPGSAEQAGQVAFLKYLSQNLPDDYFAIRSPLIQSSLNIDVLLLGPTGIWLFEVKHWPGRITYHHGTWQPETAPTPQTPQKNWLDARNIIEQTLKLRLARNANFGALIYGGLVFTHPQAEIQPAPGSKIQAGTPPQWLQRIRAASKMSKFTTEVQLLVLDILFDYALSNYITRPLVSSAVELAKVLYGDTLDELREYILRQVRSRLNPKG